MADPRVLCMQATDERKHFFDPLREVADVDFMVADQATLERILPEYDAFFIELQLQLRRELIDRCPKLKLVAACSTGTDHIDVKHLEAKGIRLVSLKYDTDFLADVPATAEMAWTLLLAVVRKVPWAFDSVKRGEWDRVRWRGRQLYRKTLGILGFGRLGKIIKGFGLGFRMRVIACDVRDFAPPPGVERVDLETLLRESDVLSVHIHLTDENYHFLDAGRIAMMKPGAVLINTSRGAVLDQDALISALKSGRLAGAGVDVIENEYDPDLLDHPLVRYAREHENLVISPHVGGATFESQETALRHMIGKFRRELEAL